MCGSPLASWKKAGISRPPTVPRPNWTSSSRVGGATHGHNHRRILAVELVRDAEYGCLADVWMAGQHALDALGRIFHHLG